MPTRHHPAHSFIIPSNSSLVVSRFSEVASLVVSARQSGCAGGCLFRDTLVGVEAVGELLAVLVRSVLRKQFLAGGALERLEARLALDGLRRGILVTTSA